MSKVAGLLAVVLLSVAVATGGPRPAAAQVGARGVLPEPVTNNAVARLERGGHAYFYSFNGLGPGKTHRDIRAAAWEIDTATGTVVALPDVPGGVGRLASVAVGLYHRVFVFGGYTVAPDGAEKSTPGVFALDPATRTYTSRAPMPTPVDDAVAFAYLERYIYLVSGWHDTANVALVQVFDSWRDRWFRATDYPGSPVFGHAGGIAGNTIVIADGVKLLGGEEGRRRFGISDEAYRGEVDAGDPSIIDWTRLPPHPGTPLYRMAAAGAPSGNRVLFAGGSGNPYNYDGIGYDGTPSEPSNAVFAYDVKEGRWRDGAPKPRATMDHRGLLSNGPEMCTLGGMAAHRTVIADIDCWTPGFAD